MVSSPTDLYLLGKFSYRKEAGSNASTYLNAVALKKNVYDSVISLSCISCMCSCSVALAVSNVSGKLSKRKLNGEILWCVHVYMCVCVCMYMSTRLSSHALFPRSQDPHQFSSVQSLSSGHYRPNIQSMGKVDSALQKLYESNPNLFHKDSKWRKGK